MPLRRLLLLTFIESLATVLFERGVYFYTESRLAFSPSLNLWLAVTFGAVYVAGALASHAVSRRWGERRVARVAIAVQVAMCVAVTLWPTGPVVFAAAVVLGGCNGIKWPIIESYIGAGRSAASQATAVGRFNMAWSASVPLALVIAGPLIALQLPGLASGVALFVIAGLCSIAGLWLTAGLSPRPVHLDVADPARLPADVLARYRGLLASSRRAMLCSYSLLFVLAPLMPFIFGDLGFGPKGASSLSGVLDAVRFATFAALGVWAGWHGRAWPLLVAVVLMPAGFFMIVSGQSLMVVLAGEVVFGLTAGMSYYAALYYALAVKNASVDAGGVHEGLIGGGFFLGPLLGVAAQHVGFLAAIGPMIVICGFLSLWHLRPQRAITR